MVRVFKTEVKMDRRRGAACIESANREHNQGWSAGMSAEDSSNGMNSGIAVKLPSGARFDCFRCQEKALKQKMHSDRLRGSRRLTWYWLSAAFDGKLTRGSLLRAGTCVISDVSSGVSTTATMGPRCWSR
jgi:hypothetical protein